MEHFHDRDGNDAPEGYDTGHVRIYQYRDDWYKIGSDIHGTFKHEEFGHSVELQNGWLTLAVRGFRENRVVNSFVRYLIMMLI